MFKDCSNLETIYVGDEWSTTSSNITTYGSLFSECNKLQGQNGTKYIDTKWSISGARLDTDEQQGYFSTLPVEDET